MHTTTLRKVGGSVMLAMPPALLDVLQIGPGDEIGMSVDRGRLIARPRPKPHYTLEQLLAQTKPRRGRKKADPWLTDDPVGRELI